MYLQTGDEHQWLTQQRRSMAAEAASRLATTMSPRESKQTRGRAAVRNDVSSSVDDPARATVGRLIDLLQSGLAGIGTWRRRGVTAS